MNGRRASALGRVGKLRYGKCKSPRSSICKWKGQATDYSTSDDMDGVVANRTWSYNTPTGPFVAITRYLSFYAGPRDCFVGDEKAEPQPGDLYGGCVTSDIDGTVKGRMGNLDPVWCKRLGL
ncbi:hypothetical protein F4824DRAFT_501953 [Ustulina deusta]|nr:hypothetical protein F4824DRAFT_501953 [Ustulina deusta]